MTRGRRRKTPPRTSPPTSRRPSSASPSPPVPPCPPSAPPASKVRAAAPGPPAPYPGESLGACGGTDPGLHRFLCLASFCPPFLPLSFLLFSLLSSLLSLSLCYTSFTLPLRPSCCFYPFLSFFSSITFLLPFFLFLSFPFLLLFLPGSLSLCPPHSSSRSRVLPLLPASLPSFVQKGASAESREQRQTTGQKFKTGVTPLIFLAQSVLRGRIFPLDTVPNFVIEKSPSISLRMGLGAVCSSLTYVLIHPGAGGARGGENNLVFVALLVRLKSCRAEGRGAGRGPEKQTRASHLGH